MSEIDLVLVNETDNCTIYTLQFDNDSETSNKQSNENDK